MSAYVDNFFLSRIEKNITTIVEVGARELRDTLYMESYFKDSHIYSFEPHPLMQETIQNNLKKSSGRITFLNLALGDSEKDVIFYMYHSKGNLYSHAGCSSLYKRIDNLTNQTMYNEKIKCSTLDIECQRLSVDKIDLLTLDTQGSELDILKGSAGILPNIRYVLLECPKESNTLLNGLHSKHINSPTYADITSFLSDNGFVEVCRQAENDLEWNILFKNNHYA